jgi:hypothetical protein
MSGADATALALEAALLLGGVALIGWLLFSPRGRAAMARRLPPWDIAGVDFAAFVFLVIFGALGLSALANLATRRMALSADALMVAGSVVMELGFLAGIAAFHGMYRARARGAPAPGGPSVLASGLVTFLVAIPLVDASSAASGYVFEKLGLPSEPQNFVDILASSHSAWLKGLLMAAAVLIVPLAEEGVFRAGLFRFLRTRMPPWAAITLTSLLFAAMHVDWSGHLAGLAVTPPLFILAAVFCLAYERTGRIGTCVVAHALFNLHTILYVASGTVK